MSSLSIGSVIHRPERFPALVRPWAVKTLTVSESGTGADYGEAMARLLLHCPTDASADAGADRMARAGRELRDAGHEVVHAGAGLDDAAVAVAAVQEDVDAVLLVAGDAADGDDPAAGLRQRLAAAGADDVRVLVVGPGRAVVDALADPGAGTAD